MDQFKAFGGQQSSVFLSAVDHTSRAAVDGLENMLPHWNLRVNPQFSRFIFRIFISHWGAIAYFQTNLDGISRSQFSNVFAESQRHGAHDPHRWPTLGFSHLRMGFGFMFSALWLDCATFIYEFLRTSSSPIMAVFPLEAGLSSPLKPEQGQNVAPETS